MSTITGIATSDSRFNILTSALTFLDSNLGTTFVTDLDTPSADVTVFAPTDTAFGVLAQDLGYAGDPADEAAVTSFLVANVPATALRDVILYHVSPGAQTSTDIATAGSVATALGLTITPDLPTLVDNEPDLIDPSLVQVDVMASNGIVHVIDRVLLPIDLPGNDAPTIAGIVAASGGTFDTDNADFDILLTAAQTAGLVGVLDDPDLDLTAFAPTDAAFIGTAQALGFSGSDEAGAWDYLVEAFTLLGKGDPIPLLTEVLTYHVSGTSLQASQVLASTSISTLQGGTLGVDPAAPGLIDNDPDLPDPDFVALDIQASNGVAHVIDGVLLPVDILPSSGVNDVDFIIADDTRNFISTRRDDDFIDANGGRDYVLAGSGNDVVLGGTGRDALFGQSGKDTILGEGHNDYIAGGRGADLLDGGQGNDTIVGGNGADTIIGGEGDDWLFGNRGRDVFKFQEGDGHDLILSFGHADKIDLTAYGFEDFDALEDHIDRGFFGGTIDLGDDDIFVFGFNGRHLNEDDFIL